MNSGVQNMDHIRPQVGSIGTTAGNSIVSVYNEYQ